mmetsp:Transcript_14616/g.41468  ORF Transcript_14616/g.41468 Transcript_14616/m.41468 type:complete len:88 (-) Transcript_14616:1633-1896(-)
MPPVPVNLPVLVKIRLLDGDEERSADMSDKVAQVCVFRAHNQPKVSVQLSACVAIPTTLHLPGVSSLTSQVAAYELSTPYLSFLLIM